MGICVAAETAACLAHIDDQTRQLTIAKFKPGENLDVRGTPITPELLELILRAVQSKEGFPVLGDARFDSAQFSGRTNFTKAHFNGNATFSGAQFNGPARFTQAKFNRSGLFDGAQFTEVARFYGTRIRRAQFRRTQFSGQSRFDGAWFGRTLFDHAQFRKFAAFGGAQFVGDAHFENAQFDRIAQFEKAQFIGRAWFNDAQFAWLAGFAGVQFIGEARFIGARFEDVASFKGAGFRRAWFNNARFALNAGFAGAQFAGSTSFDGAQFAEDAEFAEGRFAEDAHFTAAQFARDAGFAGAHFTRNANFAAAQFRQAETLGPLEAAAALILDRATFEHAILIEAACPVVSCMQARFVEAAHFRLRYADLALDGSVFTTPSTLSFGENRFVLQGAPVISGDGKAKLLDEGQVAANHTGQSSRPRLLSVRGIDVSTLTLTDLDLSACLVAGAHHLDELRIEGVQPFANTPDGWKFGWAGLRGLPVWRWTRRRTLAEEHHWRAHAELSSPRRAGWRPPYSEPPDWLANRSGLAVQVVGPEHLAVLYRALRKAQEDNKDEPGAADFYYGEMEMRRLTDSASFAERFILTSYWLLSGYSLRGWRALAWLGLLVVFFAILFQHIGFANAHGSLWNNLVYTAQATLSIESKAKPLTHQLTVAGEVLRILLRLTGPLLIGLALLSIRNRVKR